MGLNFFTIILFLLSLLTQIVEGRITKETLTTTFPTFEHSPNANQSTNWAILVAGSEGYSNYRHQADVCHAYQVLKKGGLKDENIVVFMYDDIAHHDHNPKKGVIINKPGGPNVYKGVPKDYTRQNVTINNLIAAILGDKKAIKGGSGKVVNSGPNDHIFIYYADHGFPGGLVMPGEKTLFADDFIKTLKKKHESGTYKSMVIYVESCEAGSVFEGILPNNLNIYVTTASNSTESSWGTYCETPGYDPVCLGDLYSVSWMEDSESQNIWSERLEQQYQATKKRTSNGNYSEGSHVMQYGTKTIAQEFVSDYMGVNSSNSSTNNETRYQNPDNQRPISYVTVDQYEADILYLRHKVLKAQEPAEKAQAQKKLDDELLHRKQVDYNFERMGKTLLVSVNGFDIIKTVRPAGQPIVDDWGCYKSMVETYKSHCGALLTYGKKYMRAFANACNAGMKPQEMAKAISQICAINLKN